MLSWVVMGMQEAPLGPGGYNGYISNVFTENHYDQELTAQASMEELQKILTGMLKDPVGKGIPFLARKTAFQWNDPTFICLDRTRGRKSETQVPEWLISSIYGRGSVRLSIALNYMQTCILLGMLLYLLLRWRKGNLYELMGAVVFLGGYLFHLFWESSASYTIPYFVLLIPYAVCGMAEWVSFLERIWVRLRRGESGGVGEARKLLLPTGWRENRAGYSRRQRFSYSVCLSLRLRGQTFFIGRLRWMTTGRESTRARSSIRRGDGRNRTERNFWETAVCGRARQAVSEPEKSGIVRKARAGCRGHTLCCAAPGHHLF